MDQSTASGSGAPAGQPFPRTPTRKPLAHRISQIEAKIQSAGGQVGPTTPGVAAGADTNGIAAREAQGEALAKCNDPEQLRAMVQAAWAALDEAKSEIVRLDVSLQATSAQLAEQRLRAEAAEAQISDLDAKVQHLTSRNESLQKQVDPNYKPPQTTHEFTKTYSQRRVSATINRQSQIVSSPTNADSSSQRSGSSLLGDLIPGSTPTIQSSVKKAASSVATSDSKTATGSKIEDSTVGPNSHDSSSHGTHSSHLNGSTTSNDTHSATNTPLTIASTIPEEESSSSEADSRGKQPKDRDNKNKDGHNGSGSKSSATESKSRDKKGKKKDKGHTPRESPTLSASHDDTTSDAHTESGESPIQGRKHSGSIGSTGGRIKSPRNAQAPSSGTDEENASTLAAGDGAPNDDKRRSNPFKRTTKTTSTTSITSGSAGEESPSGGSPTVPLKEPTPKHAASKDPFKSKPTPELGNFVVSDTEGTSRSAVSNPRLAIWNGSTEKKRDRKRTGIDTFGSSSPPPDASSTTGSGPSGSTTASSARTDGSSSAGLSSTATTSTEDKSVKRTTSSSSIESSGTATPSSSGDYSSYGSKAIATHTKKYSLKSIGKSSGEKTAAALSKPRASTVASEDIATDVEGPSARNFRRGPSGELDSGLSIVDPSTHGKKRNGPGNGRASPGFTSGSLTSPHPFTKGKSAGYGIGAPGSPSKGMRAIHRDSDAGSTTDHEGTYHNEATEAKFRAAAGADRRRAANHNGEFGVAFGVKRGACEPPCECTVYTKKMDSYACKTCSHFPAQHQDLGQLSDEDLEHNQPPQGDRLSGSLSASPNKTDSGSEGLAGAANAASARGGGDQSARSEKDDSSSPKHMHDRALSASELTTPRSARSDDGETTTYDGSAPPSIDAHWLLNFADCFFVNQLGKGNSSTVFLGEYQNQHVAIKVLRQETHKRDLEDFKKEMEIMCSLRSPHIVHFYGATLAPKLCIVLEYCSQGTLFHYLHDDLNYVDWRLALRWMTESVRGINTLHLWKPQIVHRDLKTLNLLLDDKLKIKVCDFGLSRYVSGEHDQSTFFKMRGTFAYFAPEVYQGKPFTSKSDVYSLGIILWEICHRIIFGSHTRPFAEFKHINHDFQIIIQAAKGLRPTLPFTTPRPLVKLYEDCVAADPDARPTCQEILDRLEEISAFYDQHTDTWDALVKGGVKVRPPMLRRDSTPGSRSPSRGELLRTPIASRNLKDDLTRRGITATLLREKLSSSANSVGSPTDLSMSSSESSRSPILDASLPVIPGSPHSLTSSTSSTTPSPVISPAVSSAQIDKQTAAGATTNKTVPPLVAASLAAASTASTDYPSSPSTEEPTTAGSVASATVVAATTAEPDSPSTESAEDRKSSSKRLSSSPAKRSKSPSTVAKRKKVFEAGGVVTTPEGSDRSRSPSPQPSAADSGSFSPKSPKRKSTKPKTTTMTTLSMSSGTTSPPMSPKRERPENTDQSEETSSDDSSVN